MVWEFKDIFKNKEIDQLPHWIEKTKKLNIREINSFMSGLERDFEAIQNAIIYDYNNGLAEGRLSKIEKSLAKVDLLIIDELSYLTFNRHQSELLFQVISERSERGSVIITTNLEFSKWTELFENEMMVSALIDRVTFRWHILDMNVSESYRFKETKKKTSTRK